MIKKIIIFLLGFSLLQCANFYPYSNITAKFVSIEENTIYAGGCTMRYIRRGYKSYILYFEIIKSKNPKFHEGYIEISILCLDESELNYYKNKIGSIIYIEKDICGCSLSGYL